MTKKLLETDYFIIETKIPCIRRLYKKYDNEIEGYVLTIGKPISLKKLSKQSHDFIKLIAQGNIEILRLLNKYKL